MTSKLNDIERQQSIADRMTMVIDKETAMYLVSESNTLTELGSKISEVTGDDNDRIFLARKLIG